jgi:predicted ATPase
MFDSLEIKNFRCISDSGALSLSKLNVLVGPNNSGKSSILAVLLLLKQTLLDKDQTNVLVTSGPLVDLGSYLDMVPNAENVPLEIGFRLSKEALPTFALNLEDKEWSIDQWKLSFVYDKAANEISVQSFQLKDTSTGRELSGVRKDGKWSFAGLPDAVAPHVRLGFVHFLPLFYPSGPKPEDKVIESVSRFVLSSQMRELSLPSLFEKLGYVGPIRERIPRYSVLGTMPYSEVTPSGQNLMRVLSASRATRGGKLPIKQLNMWLDKKFRMLENVRIRDVDPGGTVKALIADDPAGKPRINLAATGTGVSQIVPVVVQTLLTPSEGCLIVEQPEVHLHPAAQTILADLFLENLDKRQYIIETHSEHFVLRIRRRIAEGKVNASDVKIMYVEKVQGRTSVRQLELSPKGDLMEWPEGFFDEGYQEALALAQASHRGG